MIPSASQTTCRSGSVEIVIHYGCIYSWIYLLNHLCHRPHRKLSAAPVTVGCAVIQWLKDTESVLYRPKIKLNSLYQQQIELMNWIKSETDTHITVLWTVIDRSLWTLQCLKSAPNKTEYYCLSDLHWFYTYWCILQHEDEQNWGSDATVNKDDRMYL